MILPIERVELTFSHIGNAINSIGFKLAITDGTRYVQHAQYATVFDIATTFVNSRSFFEIERIMFGSKLDYHIVLVVFYTVYNRLLTKHPCIRNKPTKFQSNLTSF